MSRPVGGASAVGCGMFGLVGVLISVGIVVFLGSQVLSSIDGDSGSDPAASTSITGVDAPVSGSEPRGAALAIAPDPGLADGATMAVTGAHLSPGPVEVLSCLAKPRSTTEVETCDPATAVAATVDETGSFALDYPAHRVITIEGTAYDCAARAGACALFANRPDNPLSRGPVAPVVFGEGLPPVDAVAPPTS